MRWVFVAGLVGVLSCGGSGTDRAVIRLVDIFPEATVRGTPATQSAPEPTEWHFDESNDTEWKAGTGVSGLRTIDGRLTGRSATKVPILHVERTEGLDSPDLLHQIVIRARVSEGSNLSVSFSSQESVDFDRQVERADEFPWQLSSPLVAGEELSTYTIDTAAAARTSYPASGTRHVLLRPTDVAGADFEIESVRLIFRKEHLASIPSGVSWQGLSEVYRESIVTRSPEDVRFDVELPAAPMLDLAIGTVEEGPLTFQVAVEAAGAAERVLLERTVTTPDRWQEVPLDLDELAGQQVTLSLRLESVEGDPGAIGFWGAPAIRHRGARPAGEGSPRGVVLIMMDTLRSDHLDAYGYERETAPALSQLAREGALFKDAVAQGAWTKVSAPSILSSTYPSSNGIYEIFHKLPASADTLAEVFRDAGYATWSASANGFSGRANNLHQGFEILHERGSFQLPEGQSRSKTARSLSDRLFPWLDNHQDVPFFVFFHAIDPHSPYEPYRPYDTRWGRADGSAKYEEWRDKVGSLVRDRRRNGRLPHREDLEEVGLDPDEFNQLTLDWYDGSILGADVEIRKLMEKLRELGLEDDTLVVYLSDHGEEFFDHGGGFHEDNVYGELINVPLVMRWPGVVPAGLVRDETVELLDVGPTVLELVGLEVPARMQGDSLVPLLGSSEEARRWGTHPAISEWKRRTDQQGRGVDAFSIIVDGYKLIHNVERSDDSPEFELYDHAADPLDQNDIASEHPEIVERLAEQLDGWHKWALAQKLPTDAEEAEGLDAEELERLRSLGYIQ